MYLINLNNLLSQSLLHLVVNCASLQVARSRSNLHNLAAYKIFISILAAIGCSRPLSSSAIGGLGTLAFFFLGFY